MSTLLRIHVTLEQAEALLRHVANDNVALKNHIASAVEYNRPADDKHSAINLVKKLREGEALFSTVNGVILRTTGVIKD